jgi:regulator of protease activity HflC (stomatin/prohibitin superfamily)
MYLSPFIFVKQNHVVMLERLGKFSRALEPGLNFKIPMVDQAAYSHSLKEDVLDIDH